MIVYHAFSDYTPRDVESRVRYQVARQTWRNAYVRAPWFTQWPGFVPARSSLDLGDPRGLPYVRDVFDAAFEAEPYGVCYTNLDACLMTTAPLAIAAGLAHHGCFYSLRIDHPRKFDAPLSDEQAMAGAPYPGADLFAFTAEAWARVRHRVPDVFIAAEGWDWIVKQIMHDLGFTPAPGSSGGPVVYHQEHEAHWKEHSDCPVQQHNRKLARDWAIDNGHADALHPGRYLFR